MKKAPTPPDKGTQKTPNKTIPTYLGQYGFKHKVKVKSVEYERAIEAGQHIKWVRCDGCGATFNTPQGLGGHKVTCAAAKKRKAEAEEKVLSESQQLTSAYMCFTSPKKPCERVKEPNEGRSSLLMLPAEHAAKEDNRRGNRGSSVRQVHSFLHKAKMIEMYENAEGHPSITEFAQNHNLSKKYNGYLSTCKTGWRHPSKRISMLHKAADERYRSMRNLVSPGKINKSPYAPIEHELVKIMREHRSKGRKVSKHFIRIKAKKLMKDMMPDKADTFTGSNGWFHRFCKRKCIKFRKRKSGKEKSGECNLNLMLNVSTCCNQM